MSLPLLAEEVAEARLASPLTTVITSPLPTPREGRVLAVSVTVSTDAPADLGIGAWVNDHDGTWHQALHPQPLRPGSQRLRFPLSAANRLQAEGHGATWTPLAADLIHRAGILLWSSQASEAVVTIQDWAWEETEVGPAGEQRLHDLRLPLDSQGHWAGSTGERSSASFLPQPLPVNPFDPDAFSAEAIFTHESGAQQRVPAFWKQAMDLQEGGDREIAQASDGGRFHFRFRPRLPGTYQVELRASWAQAEAQRWQLTPLVVDGEPWDGYVRVDADDPRFFQVDGSFFWPIGINYHSITDKRAVERIGHPGTPMRGTLSYEAYLRRLAAAGGNAAEIWMSNWNLALEWRGDWPGYLGLGRYGQANAARLDAVLDLAWELGIRINLVINNHGQVSERTNREWDDNPYHVDNGGFLRNAADYFTDPQAQRYQERYRRYLVARYADHPAILGWKLSSEINLTAGRGHQLVGWHVSSARHLRQLDGYGHPITTHWSGSYTTPDRRIVSLPEIDYVCINAYQGRGRRGNEHHIAQLLWLSTRDPGQGRGLHQFHKPVLVTEYGGSHLAGARHHLLTDHRSGPWASLVAGHAGSPMFWWFEWIDQYDLWAPYRALSDFIAGEDLRHPAARSVRLESSDSWWASAWVQPGRVLGYIAHEEWLYHGTSSEAETVGIPIGEAVQAGPMELEWWCADGGGVLGRQSFQHPGGPLQLEATAVRDHRAFKLWRRDGLASSD
ncbi:MAG: hypothetical protein EA402_02480 [Planctomycetota bacterium]|nr:MAG: hypothetical protein EA402_02480 [Planctomycetota bacterium]